MRKLDSTPPPLKRWGTRKPYGSVRTADPTNRGPHSGPYETGPHLSADRQAADHAEVGFDSPTAEAVGHPQTTIQIGPHSGPYEIGPHSGPYAPVRTMGPTKSVRTMGSMKPVRTMGPTKPVRTADPTVRSAQRTLRFGPHSGPYAVVRPSRAAEDDVGDALGSAAVPE
jgi:hypothetical protein